MKRNSILAISFVAVALAGTVGHGSIEPQRYLEEVFDAVDITTDIAYGQAVNDQGELQVLDLDLYEPSGDTLTARPALVWAHGGSGVGGDKAGNMDVEISTMFAKRGWVVASINYRLMTPLYNGPYIHDFVSALGLGVYSNLKDAQHDMQAAVRWLRANAAALRLAPDDVAISGHSYGGGVAAYANFNPDDPGDSGNPGYPSDVRAAFIHSSTILEPTTIGPGEPPVVMAHAMDDSDQTYYLGTVLTCFPTRIMGNICEQHVWQDGGHGLGKHRAAVVDAAAWFLCRHAVTGCID